MVQELPQGSGDKGTRGADGHSRQRPGQGPQAQPKSPGMFRNGTYQLSREEGVPSQEEFKFKSNLRWQSAHPWPGLED